VLAITRNVGLRAGKPLFNQLLNLFRLHRYYQYYRCESSYFKGAQDTPRGPRIEAKKRRA
jgi:hypothetical protein